MSIIGASLSNESCESVKRHLDEQERLFRCPLCRGGEIAVIDSCCNLQHCTTCGYVFDNPRPTLAALTSYYSQPAKYENWIQASRARDRLWTRRLKKIIRFKQGGSILDIGAGIGQFLHHARDHFDVIDGTEVSASAIATAMELYGIDIRKGSIECVDLTGRMFDVITLFHVLEHVHDPVKVVEICRAHLNRDGMLIIAVPNELMSIRKQVRGIAKMIAGKLGVQRFKTVGRFGLARIALDGTQDEIHLSHFTQPVLNEFLKRNNFDVVESGLDPYYVASGWRAVAEEAWYRVCIGLHALTGVNCYEAIWMAGRKIG